MASNQHRITELLRRRVFGGDLAAEREIRNRAARVGIRLDSTYKLYQEMAAGRVGGFTRLNSAGSNLTGFTVPAINIRTMTFDIARLIFGLMKELNVGPVVFEIARSEMGYTNQPIGEYATVILAAALAEKYRGPVFVQLDHAQFNAKKYFSPNPDAGPEEREAIQMLIMDALEAGIYNIDIDASTLVKLEEGNVTHQQRYNIKETAELVKLIRNFRPPNMPHDMVVTIGGEIGEVGKENSTSEELETFVQGVKREIGPNLIGLNKVSVQVGTAHGRGGAVDLDRLTELSQKAKELGVVIVSHAMSMVPPEQQGRIPETGCAEGHFATLFQNIVLKHLPEDLRSRLERESREGYGGEIKKTLGPFKQELWDLPKEVKRPAMDELGDVFAELFRNLRVAGTRHIIDKLYPARGR